MGREVEWCSGTALWYQNAKSSVYGHWVIVRDPLGRFQTQILFCTDPDTDSVCFINKPGKRRLVNSTPGTRSSHSRSAQISIVCKRFNRSPYEISADNILNWFPMRWQMEVTFEESRAHLGVETGRGWSIPTIARTTPLLLGLFSIVTLLAQRLWSQGGLEIKATAWYSKTLPTFSDALATVRRALWRLPTFTVSRLDRDTVKVPRQVFERMTDALCYAA